MSSCARRRSAFGITPLVALFAALASAGCSDDEYYYYTPVYPGDYPVSCEPGVSGGSIDTDALLDLDPGMGVGATVEYTADGAWRFAVTCDTYLSGAFCIWTLLVAPIDGTIDDFETEDLEGDDFVGFYPSTADSDLLDGVLLDSITDTGIDAVTVFAAPGTAMRVSADIDGFCGGPYLFWTDGGRVRNSPTNATDLFPHD